MWIRSLRRVRRFQQKNFFNSNIIADKKTCALLGNSADIDNDGLLMDVDVQPVDEDVLTPMHEDRRRHIDQFFHPPVLKVVNGKTKKYSICKSLSVSMSTLLLFIYETYFVETKKYC
jgi:hypothetical protein